MLSDRQQHERKRGSGITQFVVEVSADLLTFPLPGFCLYYLFSSQMGCSGNTKFPITMGLLAW
jgi:hypothetical protein